MILLGEAVHGSGESLNLSLEGGLAWFVSLNVGDHHQRVSTMQLFVREVIVWLTSHNFPQMTPTDEDENHQ